MVLQFDKQRMHLQVICGTLEKYDPTEDIKVLQSKVLELQDKLVEFREKVVYPAVEEIEKLVAEENKKSADKAASNEENEESV